MRRTVSLNVALLLFSASTGAGATTYQVGPNRAMKTLGAVASQLNPGDVVEVDGDATYTGGIVLARPGGVGNPIVVRGVRVNGKRPVLSGGTNSIEIQGDHYVLEGFEVTAGTSRCVYHHSDDVTMRDLVVHDCKAHGLLGADQDSGSLTLEYSEFYKSGSGTGQHQIYMATDEVAHPGAVFRMQHCYVHDGAGGNNVKSRAERNEIYYNWIEGALYHELELIGPDPDGAAASWTEGLKREDSDVVGNVLRKTRSSYVVRFGGDGTGQSNGRYRFVANTVLTQPGGSAVFRLFDGLESVEMHDNVFYVDPTPSGASTLVRDAEATWVAGRIVGGSHNWVLTQAAAVPAEWTDTVTGTDPKLVSLSSMDLRPVASGPLAAGCTCISSPANHDFPSALPWPEFEPPLHALEAPGTAPHRSVAGTLYVGAYQPSTGSAGTGGTGGTSGAGGASGVGGTSGGGAGAGATGGTSSAGATASGGSTSMGGGRGDGGAVGATAGGGAGGSASSARGGSVSSSPGAGGAEMGSGAAGQPRGDGARGAAMGTADATSGDDAGCGCKIEAMQERATSRRSVLIEALAGLFMLRRTRCSRWGKMSRARRAH